MPCRPLLLAPPPGAREVLDAEVVDGIPDPPPPDDGARVTLNPGVVALGIVGAAMYFLGKALGDMRPASALPERPFGHLGLWPPPDKK